MKMIRRAVPNSVTRSQRISGSGRRDNPLSWSGPNLLSNSSSSKGFESANGRSDLTLEFDGGANSDTFTQSVQVLGHDPIVIPVLEPVPPPSRTRRSTNAPSQPPAKQAPRADLTMLTSADICTQFQVAKRTLQKWRKEGKFPQPDLVIGITVRWQATTVEAWVEDNRQKRGVKRPRRGV